MKEEPHVLEVEGQYKGPQVAGELDMRPQPLQQEPVFHAGVLLRDDTCQLMLICYGGPNLWKDLVSFVH